MTEQILGTLRAAEGEGVVRMDDRFDVGIDELWSAVTDPGRLAGWWGRVEGDLRAGGEFRAHILDAGDFTGRVDVCEPPHHLRVTMRDSDPQPGQPEQMVTEVRLTADGHGTLLVLEERGMPVDLLAAYGAGIQIHVEHLADHLAGRALRDTEARWGRLFPAYQPLAPAAS
jgi:uncharacterized protein YndB with AHSA1/START domain